MCVCMHAAVDLMPSPATQVARSVPPASLTNMQQAAASTPGHALTTYSSFCQPSSVVTHRQAPCTQDVWPPQVLLPMLVLTFGLAQVLAASKEPVRLALSEVRALPF